MESILGCTPLICNLIDSANGVSALFNRCVFHL